MTKIAFSQEITFPYYHSSSISLINDSIWLKANAEKYLNYLIQPLVSGGNTLDSTTVFYRKIQSYLILNKNEEALRLLQPIVKNYHHQLDIYSLVFYFGYFKQAIKPGKNKYFNTAINTFESFHPTEIERLQMQYEKTDRVNGGGILNYATNDTLILKSFFESKIHDLSRKKKEFNFIEMGLVIRFAAFRKMSKSIGAEQNLVAKKCSEFYILKLKDFEKTWGDKDYHFKPRDKPETIVAANFQAFDKSGFDDSNIWVNNKEIPNNGVDDDENGTVDDVNGVISNPKKVNQMDGVPLIINDMKLYLNKLQLDSSWDFKHGNMSVELMLKGNPKVKMMALEHQQYDDVWNSIQQRFTDNVKYNQYLIDSLVQKRIKIWKQLALYCKANNVRVAEINSFGFLLSENIFAKKGCGNDSIELLNFNKEQFWKLAKGYKEAFELSPNTLFILCAGNDRVNSEMNPNLSNVNHLPNTLVVGALNFELKKAIYSNYGKSVDVYAPAHFILKNKNSKGTISGGTSAAAPVVCNLAIKILCLNPKLTSEEVKNLIMSNADKEPFEKGINIINPKKTIELMPKPSKI